MPDEEIITKRIHVSGLTPAITAKDLSQRLGTFGTVTALDGFGKVDALGQPRKFAYVTLETTKSKLARCMNLLSGVTWKGTKLRLGEAKPDFRERIARENAALKRSSDDPSESSEPPRKKRRRVPKGTFAGDHAPDMSPVTPETAGSRKGWKVTPLGRIIHPVRMRPPHPLPDPVDALPKKEAKGAKEKRRKKAKEPPTRARRRTIDPTKWGSQHLKGAFLDAVIAPSALLKNPSPEVEQAHSVSSVDSESSETESSVEEEGGDEVMDATGHDSHATPPSHANTVSLPPAPHAHFSESYQPDQPTESKHMASTDQLDSELLQEKNASLGLLQSLFGSNDDWGGEETLSDVDMDAIRSQHAVVDIDDDIEVVPREKEKLPVTARESSPVANIASPQEQTREQTRGSLQRPAEETSEPRPQPAISSVAQSKPKLKDLFSHKEDEGGFSLLGHLDIDDELEDASVLGLGQGQPIQIEFDNSEQVSAPVVTQSGTTLLLSHNSKDPLFFPLPEDVRPGFKGKAKDPFEALKEKGIDWTGFTRTATDAEIKERWEENKRELTKEWKRRHREALKSRRRRGGYDGGAD